MRYGLMVVAEGYVRKTLNQYMKYEPILSQWATCVAQEKPDFGMKSGKNL